jgi:thioredoxin 1
MKIINETMFDEEVQGLVVVTFSSIHCGPCRMLEPVLEELDEQFENVKFVKVNVQESMKLSQKMGVSAIPTVLFFKNGEVIDKVIGLKHKSHLEGLVTKLEE